MNQSTQAVAAAAAPERTATARPTPTKHRDHFSTPVPLSQYRNLLLTAALSYATTGMQVIPLRGKVPAIPSAHPKGDPLHGKCKGECGRLGHGAYDATADPEQVGILWKAAGDGVTGIGWRMGDQPDGSRILAIDPDREHDPSELARHRIIPGRTRTVTARTGGGGWHLVFRVPSDLVDLPAQLAEHIDIKADGGYIVVAPSVHPETGKPYKWLAGFSPLELDPAPMPAELVDTLRKLAKPASKPRQAHGHDHGAASGFSKAFCDLLDKCGVTYDAGGGDQLVLCPFHDDSDPSLHVDPDRAVYHCFAPGCAAHGGGGYLALVQIAQAYGILTVDDAEDTTVAEAWRLSRDEWNTCPQCKRLVVQRLETGQWVSYHSWCKSPDCVVWRKVQCRRYLTRLTHWEHIGIITARDGKAYRKARDMVRRGSSDYIGVCTLQTVDGSEPVYQWSIAYNAGSDDSETALATMTAAVMTKAPGRRVAQPHKPKTDKPDRVKPVFDFRLVIAPSRRREVLRILENLGIEVKRMPYGGWETAGPVDADKDVVLQAILRRLATQPGYYLGEKSSIVASDDALVSDKWREAWEAEQDNRKAGSEPVVLGGLAGMHPKLQAQIIHKAHATGRTVVMQP